MYEFASETIWPRAFVTETAGILNEKTRTVSRGDNKENVQKNRDWGDECRAKAFQIKMGVSAPKGSLLKVGMA
jgi:hypothetical protein